ncbi:type II secretion system F family protein [Glaesserella parasuis]|uniref:Type II secretion system F family protein n=1 Tax=Glaesserella parasuis TaxID=738 RepID=A0AAJ6DB93_GLAPU|nr:type II secretion system F family protein [Glaesserella parasuis]MDG6362211.1 type II secretion system F family protein [Glaesserella parasuis]MDO9814947.1 type II secretion system F family protein [Glaesserella parasuis]MDO9896361.1 type II secretion system F family protein [Glaesserella parasuis]WGE10780.1 type II secretion system F family protein [Glaesserella parasuis]
MNNIYEFQWKGRNRFGQKQTGRQLAESREVLEKRLQQKGYSQLRISRHFALPTAPKKEEINQFMQQLALLIQAKIPLKQSLVMLLETCQNRTFYRWQQETIRLIEAGFALSVAFEKQGKYINPQEIQLIKMAETSGNLGLILTNIAQRREKSEKLTKKIKKILFYPVFILAISITLSILLLLFIVPQFAELYGSKGKSLPLITEILFSLSHFLQHSILTLIILCVLCFLLIHILNKKTDLIKRLKFIILSHIPILKGIIQYSRIIFFCQNSSLMLASHIRLDTVLHSFLANKSDDILLQRSLATTLTYLKQGYRLADSLDPKLFPTDMLQMIAIGEQSGKLSPMLQQISDGYQQRLDYQIDILSQLLEPMLMVLMGIIVGAILVGLYLPIFDMGAMIE